MRSFRILSYFAEFAFLTSDPFLLEHGKGVRSDDRSIDFIIVHGSFLLLLDHTHLDTTRRMSRTVKHMDVAICATSDDLIDPRMPEYLDDARLPDIYQ